MRTLKKIRRRLLSVILCLCMVLSSFVYADTAYTTDDVSPRENHVENGSGGGYKPDRF